MTLCGWKTSLDGSYGREFVSFIPHLIHPLMILGVFLMTTSTCLECTDASQTGAMSFKGRGPNFWLRSLRRYCFWLLFHLSGLNSALKQQHAIQGNSQVI